MLRGTLEDVPEWLVPDDRWTEYLFSADAGGPRPVPQVTLRFPNGYGASIVGEIDDEALLGMSIEAFQAGGFPLIESLAEVAVIRFTGDTWDLDFTTPVGAPLRRLGAAGLDEVLDMIYHTEPPVEA